MKSSIIANEELMREVNPDSAIMIGVLNKTSKITNSIAIVSSSDSIIGKPPETFVEEIQCNLYEEIKAEIEARMEEEMVDKPSKDKERNYGYLKKVSLTHNNIVSSSNKNSGERYKPVQIIYGKAT